MGSSIMYHVHGVPQCTVLEYTSGWVIRSLIPLNWVLNRSYGLPEVTMVCNTNSLQIIERS